MPREVDRVHSPLEVDVDGRVVRLRGEVDFSPANPPSALLLSNTIKDTRFDLKSIQSIFSHRHTALDHMQISLIVHAHVPPDCAPSS